MKDSTPDVIVVESEKEGRRHRRPKVPGYQLRPLASRPLCLACDAPPSGERDGVSFFDSPCGVFVRYQTVERAGRRRLALAAQWYVLERSPQRKGGAA